ncbi:hypothetical protein, partial [Streptomyces klenkii]|uniref:hypothetical protein n=1 Tax=Streptomyces klenkii TaxID=1420899 RepID=UPI001A7E8F4A
RGARMLSPVTKSASLTNGGCADWSTFQPSPTLFRIAHQAITLGLSTSLAGLSQFGVLRRCAGNDDVRLDARAIRQQ